MTTAELVVDHGKNVGLGHLRRCLVLADALAHRGVAARFLVPTSDGRSLAAERGYAVGTWDDARRADVRIVDAYDVAQDSSDRTEVSVWLDDLGRPGLAVDLVVNPNGYGPEIDYGDQPGEVLAGLRYSLVAPAFVSVGRAIADRSGVVVAFGGTDDGTLAGPVASAIRAARVDAEIDVVVSPLRPPTASLPADVTIHHGADMPALMAARKVYVGAAGGTSYEALSAGLAVVACSTVDNQVRNATFLSSLGAVHLPRYDATVLAMAALRRLDEASPRPPSQPDGDGPARIADRILELVRDRLTADQST